MIYHEPSVIGALSLLAPGAEFVARNSGDVDADYADVEWLSDGPIPSLSEVKAEIARIESEGPTRAEYEAWVQAEYERTEYQRLRAPEYPPLTDLADAIFWQQQGDDSKMAAYVAACEAVKAKYPKPE